MNFVINLPKKDFDLHFAPKIRFKKMVKELAILLENIKQDS